MPDQTARKDDSSPVTVADLGSQALISMALHDAFPGDAIVGEEDARLMRADPEGNIAQSVIHHVGAARPGPDAARIMDAIDGCGAKGGPEGRFWTLDPVDGTKGFLRGGQYAVALSLIEDGEVMLGVLGCPNLPVDPHDAEAGLGCLFVAERGAGTWMLPLDGGNEVAIKVKVPKALTRARWVESVEPGHSALETGAAVAKLLGLAAPLQMDSQAKYATVARNQAAIYLRLPTEPAYRERIWDHAAGWLIVREAGGEVTDADGAPFDFGRGRLLERNTGVVATSGGDIHAAVLEAVASVLKG